MSRSYVCSSKSTQLLFIISTIAAFVVNPPAAHALKIHTNPTNEYNTLKHRKLLLDQQTPLQQAISQYIPIDQLASYLKGYTKRCGDISRLITIGKSEKYSYPIYALEISDKPGVEEPEPNVKLVAGIHGDEPLGLILTTGLAEWLCANYNTDDTARKIVAQSHLYLVPTLNPDGYKDATRTNGKGYDLNRNFPDRFRNFTASNFPIQSETSAIINWLNQTQFVSSLAFHGGSLVANYPWDASRDMSAVYTAAPDDAAFKFLATTYSKAHASMAAQATEEFPDGMTNGAAWYSIQGSMQDYNYGVGKCMELTIELGDVKWPDKKALPKIFEDNRNSLLDFITASAFGGYV